MYVYGRGVCHNAHIEVLGPLCSEDQNEAVSLGQVPLSPATSPACILSFNFLYFYHESAFHSDSDTPDSGI